MKRILDWISKYKSRIIYSIYAVIAIGICYEQQLVIKRQFIDDISSCMDTSQKSIPHVRGIVNLIIKYTGSEFSVYDNHGIKTWLYNPLEEWRAPLLLATVFFLFWIFYILLIEPWQIRRELMFRRKIDEQWADIEQKTSQIEWRVRESQRNESEINSKTAEIATLGKNLSQYKAAYEEKRTKLESIEEDHKRALKAKDDEHKNKEEEYIATEKEMSGIFAKKIFVLEKQVIALEKQLKEKDSTNDKEKDPPGENAPAPDDDNSI